MSEEPVDRAVAIVGVAAIMPDAPDAATFWQNIQDGRYSISEVTPDRWDPALYFDPDPQAPDKSYSKIGGWVRDFEWDPLGWKLPVPPRVSDAMDDTQKWAVNLARAALVDYGWPERPLDNERTAVVIGNAMAGERHYLTALRINFPEFARELEGSATFAALPQEVREAIVDETGKGLRTAIPDITEDTMPGELANIIAGRVANLFNFRGPSYVTDAACASGLAAAAASIEGLINGEYDAALTGGIDRNMGAATYVKFCKIGALSATGTRPYADGADGFVMGEGGTLFLLKRLADAERDGDRIYAVLLGMAGSSDGRGKGITAPNPIGQRLAVERAWQLAGVAPSTCSLVEGHGTSTAVGDVVEVAALTDVFGSDDVLVGSIPLGSVKSNIGHLKGAAGTAGLFKATMALHHKVLPASIHAEHPNPNIDFGRSPFTINTEQRPWDPPPGGIRRAGVSAFGFGGTNFHGVLEEHVPGRHRGNGARQVSFADIEVPATSIEAAPAGAGPAAARPASAGPVAGKVPLRGALVTGAADDAGLAHRLREVADRAAAGEAPAPAPPMSRDLAAPVRVAIDHGDAAELADKASRAAQALETGNPAMWRALRARGTFLGRGHPGKVAFLYTGQGSQYVNMLKTLRLQEPVVADTFAQADRVMTPLLGKPLTEFIFIDEADAEAVARLEQQLLQTEITQPAVLATDIALTRLLATYGVTPDIVMGHSLGEYGALVAAGALSFEAALEAVSARGSEMANLSIEDNGAMAAVFAPLEEIERVVASIEGYVVVANVNSPSQAVIGGATAAVEAAVAAFVDVGHTAIQLPVSHAFHTSIVAPASEPLRQALVRLELRAPTLPIVANVDGGLYPMGPGVQDQMLDILARQVASPVQFVKGLRTLYAEGARVFVEVGPKKALHGFVEDALGAEHDDVVALFTNHPKQGDIVSFNQALCGLYAAGLGAPAEAPPAEVVAGAEPSVAAVVDVPAGPPAEARVATMPDDRYTELGHLLADFLERSRSVWEGPTATARAEASQRPAAGPTEPVVITGAALGLPGTERVFDDGNLARILGGQQFIDLIPQPIREAVADKHITRLVKSEAGAPRFETIESADDVIKLAARAGALDLVEEFGVDADRDKALDDCTRLAIGAGLDALRDAGIPLVMRYKTTTVGTKLPERWGLPDALRDDTGVIFASAFPGYGEFAADIERCLADRFRRQELATLHAIRSRVDGGEAAAEIDRRTSEIEATIEAEPFEFDRRFLFRVLSMGHSQFAEIIGARGPNTQVNAACASTTQAVGLAQDWIRAGRCRRVVIVAADNVTSDSLLEWVAAGFLATGAAATDEAVEDAAIPFDNRRHGMLLGMGAASIVVESADAARERGVQPICEVLATVTANSAFHGTKLDVDHISAVMEGLVAQAEERGVDRQTMAPETVFVSHETYTPARGGSAQAEISALRAVFGATADGLVIANTKGFTGHPMGVGIEDVVAIKALETGIVPPVPNFKEVDPSLGSLNLSIGGAYPVRYALRLAAGFGSQISMVLLRWTPVPDGAHRSPTELGYEYRIIDRAAWARWLSTISGTDDAGLEVVQRRLRVIDTGPAAGRDASTAAAAPAAVQTTAEAPAMPASRPEPEPVAAPVPETEPAAIPTPVVEVPEPQPNASGVSQAEVSVQETPQRQPTPTPQAEPEPIPEPAAAAAAVPDLDVEAEVLAVVAGKTGYPADMLDLDLDLEADLGIDTVKQAEVFALIRERFDIERDDKLKLRDYPTLSHVIGFVRDRAPGAGTPTPPATVPEPQPNASGVSQAEVSVQETPQRQPTPTPQAEPEPTPEPAAAAAAVPDLDVEAEVLAVVAGKTGYPADMLDLDLDLEADLGIDTVKQAEVFALIRERFDIERDDKLKLRDYPTLSHVIGFVRDRASGSGAVAAVPEPEPTAAPAQAEPEPVVAEPEPAAAAEPEPQAEPEPIPEPAAAAAAVPDLDVEAEVLAVVAGKTGYPADMLDLDLDLEADLGIDTVKQAEVFALIRERFDIERDDKLKLRDYPTLSHVIGFVRDRAPGAGTPTPPATVPEPQPNASGVSQAEVSVQETPQRQPTPTPQAEPEPTPEPAAAAATTDLDVEAEVLAVVAGKTGYPADMLDLDLDLEADLGIDTVKQAEVFALIRERFDIERDDKLKLRDYPTLSHVIGFVRDRASGHQPATQSDTTTTPTTTSAEPEPSPEPPVLVADVTDADRVPRRVPVPTIRPPLGVCAPTGVELEAGMRVVAAFDRGGAGAALADRLTARGVEVLAVDDQPDAEELVARIDGWLAAGPIRGVYWLAALDHEGALAEMDLAAWREANRVRVKLLYATMRRLYDQISGPGTFLLTATRLGGRHGYDEAGAYAPLGGAVTGFAKAFARERPVALVKAIDFAPAAAPGGIAELLVEETLHDPGAVEVGHADGLRWTVTLEERPVAGGEGMVLGRDTVFVVTGAAGGIVSAITADLAGASGGIFHLLDLTPEPDADDPDLRRVATDREGLKADLIERLRSAGERPTPVMVERELARLERLAAAQSAIDAVRAAGGQAHYHSVDLTDGEAVERVVGEVAAGNGRIDVLLHAAGLDISHSLPDKEPSEYDLVFDVKSDGWFNLLRAIADLPLGVTVAFSSVAGRFGNLGQTDYSAANDLLCKLASALRTTRPDTRAIAIDWTAWAGIGMASRGSIPKMMELAGIEMLAPEVGIPTIRRELTADATGGEVVVGGRLGVMVEERAERGGIDAVRFATDTTGPMVGRVVGMGVHGGLVVETTLDPAEQPFLGDHQIEGTPVLPGVMGIEGFAEVAGLPLPGWRPVEIEEVEFLAPCKFYRHEPRTVAITATYRRDGDQLVADCRLVGTRQLANQPEPQVTTHFTGKVRLAREPAGDDVTVPVPPSPNGKGASADAIYEVYFHGPAFRVLERAWRDEHGPVGLFAAGLPDDHTPAARPELLSPRLIELFFQTAGIWEIGRDGRFGLPQHVDRIVLHPALGAPHGRVEAIVEPGEAGFDGRVVDEAGTVLLDVQGYRTVELPGAIDPALHTPLAEAMA